MNGVMPMQPRDCFGVGQSAEVRRFATPTRQTKDRARCPTGTLPLPDARGFVLAKKPALLVARIDRLFGALPEHGDKAFRCDWLIERRFGAKSASERLTFHYDCLLE